MIQTVADFLVKLQQVISHLALSSNFQDLLGESRMDAVREPYRLAKCLVALESLQKLISEEDGEKEIQKLIDLDVLQQLPGISWDVIRFVQKFVIDSAMS